MTVKEKGAQFDVDVTNFCKGIAILLMLCHHLVLNTECSSKFLVWLGNYSKICVSIFVFLSGLGLYRRGSHSSLQRIFRLYANWWFLALVFIAISSLVFGRGFSVVYPQGWFPLFVVEMLGLKSTCSWNPTWWFMGTAVILYVLYPLLRFGVDRCWQIVLLVAVAFLFVRIRPGLWLLPFTLGMFAAKWSWLEQGVSKRYVRIACWIGLIASFCRSGFLLDGPIACVFCFSLFQYKRCFSESPTIIWNIFIMMGRHSMNMFLCHTFFFQYFFENWFSSHSFYITLPILTAVSFVSSVALEGAKKKIKYYSLFNHR